MWKNDAIVNSIQLLEPKLLNDYDIIWHFIMQN